MERQLYVLMAIDIVEVQINIFHLSGDQVINSSRDFEDWVLALQVTSLSGLVAIDIAEVQI